MNELLCVFPFVLIDKPASISSLQLIPYVSADGADLNNREKDLIAQFTKTLRTASKSLDGFTYARIPSDSILKLESLKRASDFLRLKLSYYDSDLDYKQALFIIILGDEEGSLKISIDGANTTLLDRDSLLEGIRFIETKKLQASREDFPQDIFDSLLNEHKGLRLANEEKFWRALDWYGKSFIKGYGLDDRHKVICLAIAFEALLDLPQSGLTESFLSYIRNIFADCEDINDWAENFYNIRSRVVHGDEVSLVRGTGNTSRKGGKPAPSMHYKPKGAHQEFLHHVRIARFVFRDVVEALSNMYSPDRSGKYVDAFFTADHRLRNLLKALKGLKRGFLDEDDCITIELQMSELRYDITAKAALVFSVTKEFIKVLRLTFEDGGFDEEIKEIADSWHSLKSDENHQCWMQCKDSIERLRKLQAEENAGNPLIQDELNKKVETLDDLLSLPPVPFDLNSEVIEVSIEWFSYAQKAFYK